MALVPSYSEGPVPRSLADALSQGPLPLPTALRLANDLAAQLRDLHQQSRAHGKLTIHSVSITEGGARLLPLRSSWDHAVPERDIHAFGQVFYQMLHGNPPPATLAATDIRIHPSESGTARLHATSTRLALRCISPRSSRLTMQQVTTELRLLTVVLRQEDTATRPADELPPTWTPPVNLIMDVPGDSGPPQDPALSPESQDPSPAALNPAVVPPIVPLGPNSFGAPKPKAPAKAAPDGGSCPKCAYPVVYVSRPRSRFEMFLERARIPIVRCHRCYHRYFVVGRFKIAKDMPVGSTRQFRPRKRHQ